nr:hypothetical protein [Tanacetum cinerariifolium]
MWKRYGGCALKIQIWKRCGGCAKVGRYRIYHLSLIKGLIFYLISNPASDLDFGVFPMPCDGKTEVVMAGGGQRRRWLEEDDDGDCDDVGLLGFMSTYIY